MTPGEAEAQAVRDVESRLNRLYSTLGRVTVHDVVTMAHAALGGPIRDFVPVLVENRARNQLARLSRKDTVSPQRLGGHLNARPAERPR